MTDVLTVRLYNVRFGDAVLVTVPDRSRRTGNIITRHILIDLGNAPLVASQIGGDDSVFEPVIEDILTQLDGKPLDLFALSHEHLDHAQGLLHAARKLYPNGEFEEKFSVRYVWLTASADPNYYDTHPEAKRKLNLAMREYDQISRHLNLGDEGERNAFSRLMANNNPQSTKDSVAYIRGLRPEKTFYLHRGTGVSRKHGFHEAKFKIWAPEEDTSEYYGRFTPLGIATTDELESRPPGEMPIPPAGVDLGAFVNLVESRWAGIADNLLAIDKAANNTSLVFSLEWRGWKLLFSGDAETRSWKTMDREGVLEPVHFLKVSHHGSHNGTPDDDILEKVLPTQAPDGRGRSAGISTWADTYNGIPHEPTNQRIRDRADLITTLDDPDQLFCEVSFPG